MTKRTETALQFAGAVLFAIPLALLWLAALCFWRVIETLFERKPKCPE